ncbi:hypothetical protein P691DRAFT_789311 [Macrolepiota fuliginosa MF-IS2]|uniref:Mediator of RNA polymerase II transcription subunit 5 n=1 Tax=Macrolepiota fuliginosa MF-IS2 TaxID=1400762 RepID=A0A9P5X211_9AGAR|nr:hypothetical protein P691DRAFT_789311 [Macrolepiota fuliginosa MF-IS2]
MIVKGSFEYLTLAIYGEIVAEQPLVHLYEPRALLPQDPEPLSEPLDPSQSADPTALARSLLALIPNAPSLPSAIRLMFCLKPTEDDWDDPDFPHIYANLDNDSEDYDLESIVTNLDRPMPDDVSTDTVNRFVERLVEFVDSPGSSDQAYSIANALNLSASQNPQFSQALLDALDLPTIFTTTTLAESPTLTCLTNASSNALIARHFYTKTNLLSSIEEALANSRTGENTLLPSLNLLKSRILGWKTFEDALSNTQANFASAAQLVYDVGQDEQALGNWLASMIMHDDIVAKVSENPILPDSAKPPPVLFGDGDADGPVGHDEFVAFVRACVGVASVLGVLAWADSVGNDDCRERALAVIHLWQGIEGYREIVNHLFLLRQLTRRLKWITTDNDPPRHSGLLAEKVLFQLVTLSSPQTILNEEMIETVLALEQPLAFISESERLALRKLALVADDGVPAAVEELCFDFGGAGFEFSVRRLRVLRVSIAVVARELSSSLSSNSNSEYGYGADWTLLEAFWNERSYGFVDRLIDLFVLLSADLTTHFQTLLLPPLPEPKPNPNAQTHTHLIDQLFSTARELLVLLETLIPIFGGVSARGVRRLVSAIVDVLCCAEAAAEIWVTARAQVQTRQRGYGMYGGGGAVINGARRVRGVGVRVLAGFVGREVVLEPGRGGAEVVLRALLVAGLGGDGGGSEKDLVGRVGQVFGLVDYVLPSEGPESVPESLDSGDVMDAGSQERSVAGEAELEHEKDRQYWVLNVLPHVLPELRMFMRVLTLEDRVHLVRRLVRLDRGAIGIGEWILVEEVKEVLGVLRGVVGGQQLLIDTLSDGEGDNDGGGEEEQEREVRRAERMVQLYKVYMSLKFLLALAEPAALQTDLTGTTATAMKEQSTSEWFFAAIEATPELSSLLGQVLLLLLEGQYTSPPLAALIRLFAKNVASFGASNGSDEGADVDVDVRIVLLLGLIRLAQADVTGVLAGDYVLDMVTKTNVEESVAWGVSVGGGMVDALRVEVGRLCVVCAEHASVESGLEGIMMSVQVGEVVLGILEWLCSERTQGRGEWKVRARVLKGVSLSTLGALCDALVVMFPQKEEVVDHIRARVTVDEDEEEEIVPIPVELPESLSLSLSSVSTLLANSRHTRDRSGDYAHAHAHHAPTTTTSNLGAGQGLGRPSTPKGGQKTPDILGTIISPPTALLRSPAATGLTKTYANNDFRSLRQVPSARLNTSRLPSMHVDDFENGAVAGPAAVSGASVSPLIVPIPMTDVSAFGGLLNMG